VHRSSPAQHLSIARSFVLNCGPTIAEFDRADFRLDVVLAWQTSDADHAERVSQSLAPQHTQQPCYKSLAHDFFRREFARAVGIFVNFQGRWTVQIARSALPLFTRAVLEIEKRLANHNEIEENQIYRWASTMLTEPERIDLTRESTLNSKSPTTILAGGLGKRAMTSPSNNRKPASSRSVRLCFATPSGWTLFKKE
jgi:hypothetical protein